MAETEKGEQAEDVSYAGRYEQAKEEKPLLGKFADGIWYRNLPPTESITDPNVSEQIRELSFKARLEFLELCKKDVELSEIQADVVKRVLSRTIVGTGVKKTYGIAGESLLSEKNPDVLLIAATYINSL